MFDFDLLVLVVSMLFPIPDTMMGTLAIVPTMLAPFTVMIVGRVGRDLDLNGRIGQYWPDREACKGKQCRGQ